MTLPSRRCRALSFPAAFALALALFSVLLTGCGMGTLAPSTTQSTAGMAISGKVFGGQQPVAGAHVHVFQAFFSAHGSSQDLIGSDPVSPVTTTDSLGSYVPTGAGGGFSITGDYKCGGGPVYLLATQGNPGLASGTNNTALALLAVIADSCSLGGTLSSSLNINIDEISTVTGVYALSGYLSAPNALLYPGNNTAQFPAGLTNAADTAMALENLAGGTVNTTTPSGGTVPAAAIATLANILASCINSNGATAPVISGGVTTTPSCGTLFANATSNGTSSGTQPTDTVTAMLNIAHNPAANVGALFGLASASPPFANGLSTQPNDFTLAVGYSLTGDDLVSPGIPAVDASGDVWFPSTSPYLVFGPVSAYEVVELSPSGAFLSGTSVGLQAIQAAIDPSNNPWFAFSSGGLVGHLSGTPYTKYSYSYNGTSNDDGHQIAIDASGNIYISDNTVGELFGVNNSGTPNGSELFTSGNSSGAGYHEIALLNATSALTVNNGGSVDAFAAPLGSGKFVCSIDCVSSSLSTPTALAVDSSANIWALNNNSSLSEFDSANSNNPYAGHYGAYPGSPFSGGGLNTTTLSPTQPYPWLAIDGGNNIWVANYTGSISEFANSGAAITPAYASATLPGGYFGSSPTCKGQGLAIDGSGNVWVSCDNSNGSPYPVLEYIGAATPVTTPLLPGNFGVKP